MRNFDSLTCNGSAIRVSRVIDSYENGNVTWRTQPSITTTGQADSYASYGASGCSADWQYWTITSIVNTWADNSALNRGLRVAAVNETWNSSFRSYRSDNYESQGFWPQLVVTYNRAPDAPAALTVSGVTASELYEDGPTLSATFSDDDGTKVTGNFEVWDVADTTGPVWSKAIAQQTPNSRLSVQVPSGLLQRTHDYRVVAWSSDGVDRSPSTQSTFAFILEIEAPAEAQGPTEGDLSLTGTITDEGDPREDASVMVEVWPSNDYLGAMPDDEEVPVWSLGNLETGTDGSFTFEASTEDIPEEFKEDDGSVHVSLNATDGEVSLPYDIDLEPTQAAGMARTDAGSTAAAIQETTETPLNVQLDLGSGDGMDSERDETTDEVEGEEEPETAPDTEAPASPQQTFAAEEPSADESGDELPAGLSYETAQSSEYRAESIQEKNERATALLAGDAATAGGGASFGAAPVRTQAASVPMNENCQWYSTSDVKRGVYERWQSIYNWDGAKATWYQKEGSSHSLQIATSGSSGKLRSGGMHGIYKHEDSSGSSEVSGLVDKNAYNRVNYRKWVSSCYGAKWQAYGFYNFFSKFTTSVQQTWNKGCDNLGKNTTFTKSTTKAYTKDGGVDLGGMIKLDAQAGYTKETKVSYKITKSSRICGTSSDGPLASRGVVIAQR